MGITIEHQDVHRFGKAVLDGGFKHGFDFPFHIWDVILPIDFHIFQDDKNHQPWPAYLVDEVPVVERESASQLAEIFLWPVICLLLDPYNVGPPSYKLFYKPQ